MKRVLITGLLALALCGPQALTAQEKEEAPESYIYATYFYCDTSRQEEADELVKANSAPIYDAAVADGTITGWGWMAHHTGGKWRRIQYHTGSSIDQLLAGQETIQERTEKAGVANDGFGQICGAHDDYIWKGEAGNSAQTDRGTAALSVYEVCDMSKEDRALEIVKTVFAPVLDKAKADGKIKSWGYNSHVLGGKFRALQTMTGSDFPSLMKARAEILDAIYQDGKNEAAEEYNRICTSHDDYLWEILHEKNG